MKKLFFLVVAGIVMTACSNSGNKTQSTDQSEQNVVVITNDLENAKGMVPGWMNENTVIAMKEQLAHSGDYASVTNDTLMYSYYYKETVKNIKNEIPHTAVFSGWVNTTVANPNFAIICNIDEDTLKYDWKAFPLDSLLTETGKWVEFSASFSFIDKPLKPEHKISIFGWNQSKKPVYIDDLKVTFLY